VEFVGNRILRGENGIETIDESGVSGCVSEKIRIVRASDNAGKAVSGMGKCTREGRESEQERGGDREGDLEAATIANGWIGGFGESAGAGCAGDGVVGRFSRFLEFAWR
ncbi:hypothetical protein ALC57_05256, partial [Trachymyrmex cornetzi]